MSSKMKKPAQTPNDDHIEIKSYASRSGDSKADNLQHEGLDQSEDILIQDGVVYERIADDFKIDLNLVPDYVRDELASATLKAVKKFISQPGGREYLDQKKALKKEEE